MGSPKSSSALTRLGSDLRRARLRRGIAVVDMASRAGASPRTINRLEAGDPGVAIGTLADVLVVLGLADRIADLVDLRKDEVGLSLVAERQPKRGRTFAATQARHKGQPQREGDASDVVDPDGAAF
jgi:transcriptional regulator with XRE-family HTH domain